MHKTSIQTKLTSLNVRLMVVVVVALLVASSAIAYFSFSFSMGLIRSHIQEELYTKGKTLVNNNNIALQEMVKNNAFSAIRELVTSTVNSDSDVIYGIYMDTNKIPWVIHQKPGLTLFDESSTTLTDSISQWAHDITDTDYKTITNGLSTSAHHNRIIEFADAVIVDSERVGTLRYGLDANRSQKVMEANRKQLLKYYYISAVVLTVFSLGILQIGHHASRRQAHKLIEPLENLTKAAKTISKGDYTQHIDIETNDEIAILSTNMEMMRQTVQDYTDNLEQKVNERTKQLKRLQEEALDNAHKAGMAEIATGTLHNVGNILNSVATSANLIKNNLDNNSVHLLKKANELLEEHIDDLEEFIQSDPKGKKLMQYYLDLGISIFDDMDFVSNHIKRLVEKVDLINATIADQQAHASGTRISGVSNERNLINLINDCITIEMANLNMNIQTRYSDIPLVQMEKLKTMQIIINLMENACEAMKDNAAADRLLIIETSVVDSNSTTEENKKVIVSFSDQGVGIDAVELTHIFSYGYTTKQNGHGFGLHSCANYMAEMNGRIWAESAGPGQGATFFLEFTIAPITGQQ